MNTLIISGGNIDKDFALDFIRRIKLDTIIAVDKGMEFAYSNQLLISYAIGDFDSVSQDVLAFYQNDSDVQIERFPAKKDSTDTQLAVEQAIAIGSRQIWILGATGSRLDHVLGNINCLLQPLKAGCEAAIVDANNHISLLCKETTIAKDEQFGKYISFLPFGGEVTGITLEGFKYPLNEYKMDVDAVIGISNEIEDEVAKVSFKNGVLIKIESRD